MDRVGIADFLRRRRRALQPHDVGLAPGRRRRTPGLRRAAVATLANISSDLYTPLKITTFTRGVTWRICAPFIAGAPMIARYERSSISYAAAVVNSLSSGTTTRSR